MSKDTSKTREQVHREGKDGVDEIPDVGESLKSTPLRVATYVKVEDLVPVRDESFLNSTGRDDDNLFRVGRRKLGGGFNLCLLLDKIDLVVDKFRVDHSRVRLAEVHLGDETGMISLRARDDQISFFQGLLSSSISIDKPPALVIRNCFVELYQNTNIRLSVNKWGKISAYPDGVNSTPSPPLSINFSFHLSKIDFSGSTGLAINVKVLPPMAPKSQQRVEAYMKSKLNHKQAQFAESQGRFQQKKSPQRPSGQNHYSHRADGRKREPQQRKDCAHFQEQDNGNVMMVGYGVYPIPPLEWYYHQQQYFQDQMYAQPYTRESQDQTIPAWTYSPVIDDGNTMSPHHMRTDQTHIQNDRNGDQSILDAHSNVSASTINFSMTANSTLGNDQTLETKGDTRLKQIHMFSESEQNDLTKLSMKDIQHTQRKPNTSAPSQLTLTHFFENISIRDTKRSSSPMSSSIALSSSPAASNNKMDASAKAYAPITNYGKVSPTLSSPPPSYMMNSQPYIYGNMYHQYPSHYPSPAFYASPNEMYTPDDYNTYHYGNQIPHRQQYHFCSTSKSNDDTRSTFQASQNLTDATSSEGQAVKQDLTLKNFGKGIASLEKDKG